MEYHVPQFIEVEDKIVGPLTLKQFIYLAGAAGLCVVFFVYLPLMFAVLLSLPVAALGGALSFYRVNGKPFAQMLEAAFAYYTSSKLFLWKRQESAAKLEEQRAKETATKAVEEAAKARPGGAAPHSGEAL